MSAYTKENEHPDRVLAPALQSLSDLCTFRRNTDPLALLQSSAGDFAPDMARIFPNDWAWAALTNPRSTRHVWFAVLSGLHDLPADCTKLRCNLLTLNLDLMLRLRFGELGSLIGSIVSRIDRQPLPRRHYDKLARMVANDPTIANWREGLEIESEQLFEFVEDFVFEPWRGD